MPSTGYWAPALLVVCPTCEAQKYERCRLVKPGSLQVAPAKTTHNTRFARARKSFARPVEIIWAKAKVRTDRRRGRRHGWAKFVLGGQLVEYYPLCHYPEGLGRGPNMNLRNPSEPGVTGCRMCITAEPKAWLKTSRHKTFSSGVIKVVRKSGPIGTVDIAKELGCSTRIVSLQLRKLIDAGAVSMVKQPDRRVTYVAERDDRRDRRGGLID